MHIQFQAIMLSFTLAEADEYSIYIQSLRGKLCTVSQLMWNIDATEQCSFNCKMHSH